MHLRIFRLHIFFCSPPYPNDKKIFTLGTEDQWHNVNCGNTFMLAVQVWDDRATILLDGKQVAKIDGIARPGAKRLGVGLAGMYETPQGAVVFKDLKVRYLKEEPKPWK